MIPIEPSTEMAVQRDPTLPPAVLGVAESLPLADNTTDASMAVLTMHHWADVSRGLSELARVARKRLVLLTIDIDVAANMWLVKDYAPEIADRDRREFPSIRRLSEELSAPTKIINVPIPADCQDGFLLAFWNRPEAVLDSGARAATSGFARMDTKRELSAVAKLKHDLETGVWDQRHGELRTLPDRDVGLRLVITELRASKRR